MVNLALQVILFSIQLMLLVLSNVPAVAACIALLLPFYSFVFVLQLTIVSAQFTFIILQFLINGIIPA